MVGVRTGSGSTVVRGLAHVPPGDPAPATSPWIVPRSLTSVRRPAPRGEARLRPRAISELDLAVGAAAAGAEPDGLTTGALREVSIDDGVAITVGVVACTCTPAGPSTTDGAREGCLRGRGVSGARRAGKREPMSGRRERSTTRATAVPAISTMANAASAGTQSLLRLGRMVCVRRWWMRWYCIGESPRRLRAWLRNSRASRSSSDGGEG